MGRKESDSVRRTDRELLSQGDSSASRLIESQGWISIQLYTIALAEIRYRLRELEKNEPHPPYGQRELRTKVQSQRPCATSVPKSSGSPAFLRNTRLNQLHLTCPGRLRNT